ncbi:MAG: hypothetical protein NTW59_03040 [Candidatus Diapherotrites archaeon]|nr:hypothetical protein [Candidatus Diapherotrites archaeon]
MTDSAEEVERKLNKAYCPERQSAENPVLDYCKHLVFDKFKKIKVERASKFGGDVEFGSFGQLAGAFEEGKLHPLDLKKATAAYVNKMLEPTRKHFEKGKQRELLEKVEKLAVTR